MAHKTIALTTELRELMTLDQAAFAGQASLFVLAVCGVIPPLTLSPLTLHVVDPFGSVGWALNLAVEGSGPTVAVVGLDQPSGCGREQRKARKH